MDFQRCLLLALVFLLSCCFVEGGYQLNSTTLLARLEGSSIIVTPHVQLNNSNYYYNLSLVLIKERNDEGEIIQAITKFNGTWSEPMIDANSQASNFTHTFANGGDFDYAFSVFAAVYQTTTDVSYGDLDSLTFQGGDLSFGFKLSSWPWASEEHRLTVRFRITTYRDNVVVHGTDLIWKDEIDPSGHVNGIVIINDAALRVHFPVTAISDGEKVYTGVGVDDIEYALELNFNFPHVNEHVYYCPSLGVTESRYEEYATVTLAVVLAIAAVILIAFFVYKWYHRRDPASVISA